MRLRLIILILFGFPIVSQAGEGWFSHHGCPKPSYNRWNYILPKVGYEWRAYVHPAPADYRTGPYPPRGADVPGVRWFSCPSVAPEVLYPPPAHPPTERKSAP